MKKDYEIDESSLSSEGKYELESLKTTKHRYWISKIFTQSQTGSKFDKCAFEPFCENLG